MPGYGGSGPHPANRGSGYLPVSGSSAAAPDHYEWHGARAGLRVVVYTDKSATHSCDPIRSELFLLSYLTSIWVVEGFKADALMTSTGVMESKEKEKRQSGLVQHRQCTGRVILLIADREFIDPYPDSVFGLSSICHIGLAVLDNMPAHAS